MDQLPTNSNGEPIISKIINRKGILQTKPVFFTPGKQQTRLAKPTVIQPLPFFPLNTFDPSLQNAPTYSVIQNAPTFPNVQNTPTFPITQNAPTFPSVQNAPAYTDPDESLVPIDGNFLARDHQFINNFPSSHTGYPVQQIFNPAPPPQQQPFQAASFPFTGLPIQQIQSQQQFQFSKNSFPIQPFSYGSTQLDFPGQQISQAFSASPVLFNPILYENNGFPVQQQNPYLQTYFANQQLNLNNIPYPNSNYINNFPVQSLNPSILDFNQQIYRNNYILNYGSPYSYFSTFPNQSPNPTSYNLPLQFIKSNSLPIESVSNLLMYQQNIFLSNYLFNVFLNSNYLLNQQISVQHILQNQIYQNSIISSLTLIP